MEGKNKKVPPDFLSYYFIFRNKQLIISRGQFYITPLENKKIA